MLFFNEDWITFFIICHDQNKEITRETLRNYVYAFKGTQVTDFVMNLNGTVSTAESKVLETFVEKYLATEEQGIPVDFKDTFACNIYKLMREENVDIYREWIDVAKEIGVRPWISIRTNDCHGNMEGKPDVRKSSYVEANPQFHVAAHRERIGYFDKCMDYGHPEVRQRTLDYIDEMLDRYDVYGIELDVMREFLFFQYGSEYAGMAIWNHFMEDFFAIVNKYEKKYGHPIKRSLILPPQPTLLIERGIDLFGFIDKIDFVTIISRWETTDTDMPIELWKQLLRGTNVQLGCGQQMLYRSNMRYQPVVTSVKMAMGQAAADLGRGGDFVYLYNFMPWDGYKGPAAEWLHDEAINLTKNHPRIFNAIGEMDTLMKQERSHVVTFCDVARFDNAMFPVLPMQFDGYGGYRPLRIPVGRVPQGARVRLLLGISAQNPLNPESIHVFVNSGPCSFVEKMRLDEKIYKNDVYVFNVTVSLDGVAGAEVKIDSPCMLEHVEIEVIPVS